MVPKTPKTQKPKNQKTQKPKKPKKPKNFKTPKHRASGQIETPSSESSFFTWVFISKIPKRNKIQQQKTTFFINLIFENPQN